MVRVPNVGAIGDRSKGQVAFCSRFAVRSAGSCVACLTLRVHHASHSEAATGRAPNSVDRSRSLLFARKSDQRRVGSATSDRLRCSLLVFWALPHQTRPTATHLRLIGRSEFSLEATPPGVQPDPHPTSIWLPRSFCRRASLSQRSRPQSLSGNRKSGRSRGRLSCVRFPL